MANASGVGGGGGSGSCRHGCGSSGSRKGKKQRIPKRGPGVAELEKILREQEQTGNGIGGISSSSSSSLVLSLPVPAVHGSCNGSSRLGCGNVGATNGDSKGVYIGRSGVFLPEQTLLPISWGSSSSSGSTWKHEEAPKMPTGFSFPMLVSNVSAPPPPLLQKNHHHSMMDLFPLSATAKTTTPPSSAGVYHQIEPPSNQKPTHYSYISSLFPEEDKIMDTKRKRPSSPVENWPPEPTRMPFRPIRPQVSRLDPLSSANSINGVFSFRMSRDQGNPSGNSSRPTTIQNCQPDLSKFNKQYPFHENTEGTLLQRPSESEPDVPVYNKGFFSFLLQPEELQRGNPSAEHTPACPQTEICSEKTGEFIDLNLKL